VRKKGLIRLSTAPEKELVLSGGVGWDICATFEGIPSRSEALNTLTREDWEKIESSPVARKFSCEEGKGTLSDSGGSPLDRGNQIPGANSPGLGDEGAEQDPSESVCIWCGERRKAWLTVRTLGRYRGRGEREVGGFLMCSLDPRTGLIGKE